MFVLSMFKKTESRNSVISSNSTNFRILKLKIEEYGKVYIFNNHSHYSFSSYF